MSNGLHRCSSVVFLCWLLVDSYYYYYYYYYYYLWIGARALSSSTFVNVNNQRVLF
ncbi:MAG: hypothetical protein N6V49_10890 [Serratia symbiotica]|nr:hypothetical protein [Serratia symbiotica]